MGQIILQMMISLDGMVSGPKGELDWIANDDPIYHSHIQLLKNAKVVLLGSGSYPGMFQYWSEVADDKSAEPLSREIGRAMNGTKIVAYTHKNLSAGRPDDEVHVIKDDKDFVEDVKRLKAATEGTILSYGGVRFARALLQNDLLDEIHLDICPIILGEGKQLFVELSHRIKLKLKETVRYDSGATMVHYSVTSA